MSTVLIIDEDLAFCRMLVTFLEKRGFRTEMAISTDTAINMLAGKHYDIILTDKRLLEGGHLWPLSETGLEISGSQIIFITDYDYPQKEFTLKVAKNEGFSYIAKPIRPRLLMETINKAFAMNVHELKTPGKRSRRSKIKSLPFSRFVSGISEISKKLDYYIKLVAPTKMSVLITGESGTGKEYAARQIHDLSPKNHSPFIAIDCAALCSQFTAQEDFDSIEKNLTAILKDETDSYKTGNGATLFLDGIDHLSYKLQSRLLRALPSLRKDKKMTTEIRVMAAASADTKRAVKEGIFHQGLYQRLNEFSIVMPPLKNRGEDLIIFLDYFLEKANHDLNKEVVRFSDEVLTVFHRYSWPGNLRELRNYIKQAVLLTQSDMITKAELPAKLKKTGVEKNTFFKSDI